MWLTTTTQPPSAGTLSPSIHRRLVATSSVGLTIATTVDQAQPRRSRSGRTFDTWPLLSSRPAPDRPDAREPTARVPHDRAAERIEDVSVPVALLVPVKTLALAKTRLDASSAVTHRAHLMRAFAIDALRAAAACEAVT